MKKGNFFCKMTSARSSKKNKSPKQRKLSLEPLESRAMLSVTYAGYADSASDADYANVILEESVGIYDVSAALPDGIEIASASVSDSDSSPLITTATKVRTPTLAKSDKTYDSVTLKITNLARYASRINIRYSTDPNFSTQSDPIPVENPYYHQTFDASHSVTMRITGLSPDTTYYFRARAVNVDDGYELSDWSTTVSATTPPRFTPPPIHLVVSSTTHNSVTLTMSNLTVQASRYNIRCSTDPAFATTADPANFSGSSVVSIANTGDSSMTVTVSGLSPNTTYYFRVRAVQVDEPSDWSYAVSATTKELTKVITPVLTKTSTTDNSVTLTASNLAVHASRYNIRYSTDPNFATTSDPANFTGVSDTIVVDNTGEDPKSVTISNLNPGFYYFRARAVGVDDGYAPSDWSDAIAVRVGPVEPLKVRTPTLAVSSTTTDSVTLTASNLAVHASLYNIRYSTDPAFATTSDPANFAGVSDPVTVANTGDSSKTVTVSGLSPNTTYYFRARAVEVDEGYVTSDWSEAVSAKTEKVPLETPTLSIADETETGVRLQVDPVIPGATYVLEYGTDPSFANANSASLVSLNKWIAFLTKDMPYYFRVKATLPGYLDSGWSNVVIKAAKVKTPELVAYAKTYNSVTLKISCLTVHASQFNIRYSTDPAFATTTDPAHFDGVSDTITLNKTGDDSAIKTITGLSPNITYYFRARAVEVDEGYVASDWSEAVSAKTDKVPLETPAASIANKTATAVQVKISAVDNAAYYVVEYSTNSDFANAKTKNYASAGSKWITGLTKNATYYFRVKATADGYADSDYSETVSNNEPTTTAITAVALSTDAPKVGEAITAAPTPAGATASYQWYRGDTAISGATTATYVPTSDDVGFVLKVVATGTGNYSGSANAATANAVVSNQLATPTLSILSKPATAVQVKIGAVSNAEYYVVEYSTNPDFASAKTKTYGSAGSKWITGLTKNATYYFRIKATAANYNDSAYSGTVSNNETTTALTSVALSTNSPKVGEAITATPAPAGATASYQWYRGDTAISGATLATYVPTTDDVGFVLKVVATGTGSYSGSVTATAANAVETDVVSNQLATPTLSISSKTATSVQIKIGAVANAKTYVVEYATNPDFANAKSKSYASAGSKWITSLTKNATYYFRVKATAADYNDSDYSPVVCNNETTVAITSVALSTDSPKVGEAVTATPTPSGATASYQWYRGSTAISGATSATYVPTTDDVGSVLKVAATGTGAYSGSVTATTTNAVVKSLAAPTAAITSKTATAVQIKIGAVANAKTYIVEYSTSSDFANASTKSFASAGAKWITSLTKNATYYFRVKATATGYADSNYSETLYNVESSSAVLDASDAVFAEIAWNDLSDDEDMFETLELDLNGFFLDD